MSVVGIGVARRSPFHKLKGEQGYLLPFVAAITKKKAIFSCAFMTDLLEMTRVKLDSES